MFLDGDDFITLNAVNDIQKIIKLLYDDYKVAGLKDTKDLKVDTDNNILVDNKNDHIAIIGISGRYPMAENIDEFWENLKSGKDCIRANSRTVGILFFS